MKDELEIYRAVFSKQIDLIAKMYSL